MTESAARDFDFQKLAPLVSRGIAALVSRTVILQLVTLAGMVALMRLLGPRDFGVFAIMQSVLMMVDLFADVGLGGALIRQPEPPSARQLSSVFYMQLGITTTLMVVVTAAAVPLLRLWADLPPNAPLLLRVLALDVVIASARLPPMLLMERRLQFTRLAALDVVGSITYYTIAVSLAFMGAGIWALVGGTLGQALIVAAIAYVLSGWRPSAYFDVSALRPLIRFGLAQQSRNILTVVSEAVTPFWGGRVLGVTTVGLLNWSRSTAYFCLRAVEIVGRVGFPLFSRLQHGRERLGESFGRAVHVCAFVTFAWIALCVALGEPMTRFIFSDKWLPAVPFLTVFALAMAVGFFTPLAAAALDAIGRPNLVARAAVAWTIWNWFAVVVATRRWQALGFAIGYASHVVVGNMIMMAIVRRHLPETRLWQRFRGPVVSGLGAWAVGRFAVLPYIDGLATLVGGIVVVVAVYAGIAFAVDRRALVEALALVPAEPEPASGRPPAAEAAAAPI